MKATPASLAPGYVLHRRPYGETSLLAELFTRESGRLGVIAKGAQGRGGRGRGGGLQPFQPLLVSWRGRGELPVLADWEAAGPPLPLQGDALLGGFYLNELLLRLCRRHDPHPELFLSYARALGELGEARPLVLALRSFEKALLDSLGLGPMLTEDRSGAPIRPGQWYRCSPQGGPQPIVGPGRGPWEVPGTALLALAGEPLVIPPELQAAVNGLFRVLIADQLGGAPLRTRALWLALRRPAPADLPREPEV
ncbi:MAG: DNA repair protein RecO [Candidatus Macondimonas sp.]